MEFGRKILLDAHTGLEPPAAGAAEGVPRTEKTPVAPPAAQTPPRPVRRFNRALAITAGGMQIVFILLGFAIALAGPEA